MAAKDTSNLCMVKTAHPNGKNFYECRRRADHVTKPGKYARQHMDSKCSPPYYWEPTEQEIESKLTTK